MSTNFPKLMISKKLGIFIFCIFCLSCSESDSRQKLALKTEAKPSNLDEVDNAQGNDRENIMLAYLLNRKFQVGRLKKNTPVLVYRKYDCSDCIERGYEVLQKINTICEENYDQKLKGLIYAVDADSIQTHIYADKYKFLPQNISSDHPLLLGLGDVQTPVLLWIDTLQQIKSAAFINKPFPEDFADMTGFIDLSASTCLGTWENK